MRRRRRTSRPAAPRDARLTAVEVAPHRARLVEQAAAAGALQKIELLEYSPTSAMADLTLAGLKTQFTAWLAGSLVLGALLGGAGASVTFLFLRFKTPGVARARGRTLLPAARHAG